MPRERDWDAIKQAAQDLDFFNEQIEERETQIDMATNDLLTFKKMRNATAKKLDDLLHGTMRGDEPASPSSNVEDSE